VLPGTPPEDTNSAPLISLSMNADRKLDMHEESRVGDVESLAYVVPDDAIVNVLSSFQMCFGPIPEHWILQHIQYFRVDHWIQHKDCYFMSNKAMFCIV
jgi:hypothetical protein